MEIKKGKSSVIVKVMYILAAVFAAAGVYMAITNAIYISSYAATYGISVGAMMGDAIQYVLTGSLEYVAYAVIIFGIGRLMSMIQNFKPAADAEEIEEAEESFGIPAEAIASILPGTAEAAPLEIANEEVEVPANEDVSEVTVGSEEEAKCDIVDDAEEAEDAAAEEPAEEIEEAAEEIEEAAAETEEAEETEPAEAEEEPVADEADEEADADVQEEAEEEPAEEDSKKEKSEDK